MIAAASSTCIARRTRPRLVTCGAPATAARRGDRDMRATSSLSAWGWMCVSASVTATSSWRACMKPTFSRSALPRLTGSRSTRQRGSPARCLERGGLGGVGRAVVEHEHLELRVVDRERGRDAGRDHRLLVVGGDQHGNAGPASLRLLGGIPLLQQPEQEASCDPQRRGAHRVERDEASSSSAAVHIPPLLPHAPSPEQREDDQRDDERRDGHEPGRARSPRCTRRTTRRRRERRARGADRARRPRRGSRATPGGAARSAPTRYVLTHGR